MVKQTIVAAQLSDVPLLVELVNKAYRGEDSKQGWTTEAEILDGIRTDEATLTEMIANNNATILKYLNNHDETVGCVYLEKKQDKLYLGMLTVSPELQTGGIGKLLMKAAEEFAIQNNCKAIEMTVITVREELIAWYERRGFSKTNRIQPFPTETKFGIPKQPLEFVVMEKDLGIQQI